MIGWETHTRKLRYLVRNCGRATLLSTLMYYAIEKSVTEGVALFVWCEIGRLVGDFVGDGDGEGLIVAKKV